MDEKAHRSGFVALIGRPSVGKSTLVNALAGEKVAIVSSKAQTTRNVIRAVITRPAGQMVLMDTPGLHQPHHKLGEYMVKAAKETIQDADLVLQVFDAARGWTEADGEIAAEVARQGVQAVLVGNKVDVAPDIASTLEEARAAHGFAAAVAVSAKSGENLDRLVETVFSLLPEGPQFYPPDVVSDQPDRFAVAEMIREKVLDFTRDEIPHSVAIDVERMAEDEDSGLIRINATIFIERDSQKGIVIGQGGRMLKAIGTAAREDIEAYFGTKVHLALWVKVREHWRQLDRALRDFGYE